MSLDPNHPDEEGEALKLHAAWADAQNEIFEMQPTSIAGLLAFIGYLKQRQEEDLLP